MKCVDLPPDWERMGDLEGMALVTTSVRANTLNFSLPDLQGNLVSLKDNKYRNKVVLVNVWGTWCCGCIREIPHLIELQVKYRDQGLEVIGIVFEPGDRAEQRASVNRFLSEKGINYPVLIGGSSDDKSVESALEGVEDFAGYPTTLSIGKNGLVMKTQVGFKCETPERPAWQKREMHKSVETLLQVQ